ncbi:RHS repeat-associated core domain-containing protein [Pectobacterium versatile]|uniref:RHS repeat-associated core domain-containing protein n=1 Tax=Pectobacterium versatile TaxID=2488639 RepID=UPI00102F11F3|nr:RHS repeat-associated core domain-containing protein [Pectobacterium versatile]TAJ02458.1 hypothetical protein EG334_19200 [Pectobacterium versatile]
MPAPAAPSLTLDYQTSLLADVSVINLTATDSVTSNSLTNFPVDGFTLSLWIKTSSVTGTICRYQTGSGSEALTLTISNPANVQISYASGGSITTGVCINQDVWTHFAITLYPSGFNHFAVEVLKDGQSLYKSIGALSYTGSGLTSGGTIALGGGATGIVAKMSEFIIWDTPRTANNIATWMQRRLNSNFAGLFLWWGLSSASDSGTLHGSTFVASDLSFRQLPTGRQDYMLASWTEVSSAATYQLQLITTDGEIIENISNLNYQNNQPYSVALAPLNKVYKAQIRAISSDDIYGEWSTTSEAVPINLLVTDITSAYANSQLTATWTAVDQASVYQTYINSVASGSPIESQPYQFDLTSYLNATTATSLQVSASSSGSFGPLSELSTPTPASQITTQYNAGGTPATLTIQFSGASDTDYYVRVVRKSDSSLLGSYYLNKTSSGYTVVISSGLQDTTYTVAIKGVKGGNLGTFVSQDVTLTTLVGPTLNPLTQDIANLSITASYQYGGSANLYNLSILPNPTGATYTSTTQSKTFTGLTTGSSYTVKVQAVEGGNLSLWSAPQSITLGSQIPQVVGVSATSDSNGNITINWSALTISGVSIVYKVRITGPDNYDRTFSGGTGTSTVINASTSGVSLGKHYCVTVCGTATGLTDGPWSEASCVDTGTPAPSPPVNPPGSDNKGDPVSVANGSYGYNFIALSANTINELNFELFYNTEIALPSDTPPGRNIPVGNRWDHIFNSYILKSVDNKHAYVKLGNGQVFTYSVPSSITGNYPIVGANNGSSLYVNNQLQYELTQANQTKFLFDSNGVLQQIQSPIGNATNLNYTNSLLTSVVDQVSGRGFSIRYYSTSSDNGRIQSISLLGGTAVTVSLAYANGDLISFTDMNNKTMSFTYYARSFMRTTVDVDGYTFITNTYDNKNRVITQKDARATAHGENYQTTFTYQDITYNGVDCLQTDFTDRLGVTTRTINQKANLTTLYSKIDIGNGNIQAIYKSFNGNNQLASVTVYEGPAIPSTTVKGNTTSYQYTGVGFLQTVTYADGGQEHYTYDDNNNKLTETDIYGNVTRYTYNSDNTLQTVTSPGGGVTTYTYKIGGFKGEIATKIDSLGNVWQFNYKSNGDIDCVVDPYSNKTSYEFDNYGRLTSTVVTDVNSTVIRKDVYVLDPKTGRIDTSQVFFKDQPASNPFSTMYTYTNSGQLQSETDVAGNTITYAYTEDLLLETITYPPVNGVSAITRYQYDRENRKIGVNYITSASAAPLYSESFRYDNINRPISFTDGNQNIWATSYSSVKEASGEVYNQQTTYFTPSIDGMNYQQLEVRDIYSRLILSTVQHEAGTADVTTRISYEVIPMQQDGSTLKVTVTQPKEQNDSVTNYTVITQYNAAGMATVKTDQSGYSAFYAYSIESDSKSGKNVRHIQTTEPTGKKFSRFLDSYGNTVCYTAGSGTAAINSYFSYDAVNRLIATEENLNGVAVQSTTVYAYDAVKQLLKAEVSSYGSVQSTYFYNGLGQLMEESFSGGTTLYTYNERNLLASLTNAKAQTLTYGYDIAGRFVSTTLPDGSSIDFTLDGNGNRLFTKLNTTEVNIAQTFDPINRLQTRTDLYGNTVSYTYSASNQVLTVGYPDDTTVSYTYDNLQRLRTVTDFNENLTTYIYYPNGFLQTTHLPGNINVYTVFDQAGRLQSKETTCGETLLAYGSYTFDDYGRVATSTEILPLSSSQAIQSTSFSYEGDRLTAINGELLTYDADGNILSVPTMPNHFTYNIFNQLKTAGDYTYTYDGDGLRVESVSDAKTTRFVQDPQAYFSLSANRPYASNYLDAFGTTISSMGVAYGTEIGISANGNQGLNRLLAVTDPDNHILAKYVYGQNLISRTDENGSYNLYLDDFIGNVIALADNSGRITDRYAYGPYGELAASVGNTDNPFRFAGMLGVTTDETGLLYMRSRYYLPEIYRFVGRDIYIGDGFNPQTLNRYSYALGNPLQYADPTGLGFFSDVWDAIGKVGRWVVKGAAIGVAAVGLGVGIGLGLTSAGFGVPAAGAGILGRAASGWRGLFNRLNGRPGYRPLAQEEPGTEMFEIPNQEMSPSAYPPGSSGSSSDFGVRFRNVSASRGVNTTTRVRGLESSSTRPARPTTTHFKLD